MYALAVASDDDEPTSDEPTSDEAGETTDESEAATHTEEGSPEEEPDSAPEEETDSAADAMSFGAHAESEGAEGKSPEEAADGTDQVVEKEAYDPNKLPPLSDRAMLFGAWGCVGILAAVVLVFFVLIKSAIDKIDDYGAVEGGESTAHEGELPPPEDPEPEEPVVTRTLEWATAYPPARAAARIDRRPIVIVFTAEYATESIDVFDGVFTNDDIERYLERYYQVVHIDMGEQNAVPDPSIALCDVEFLPHVCYVHPETEAKLAPDTTGIVSTSALLRDLGAALATYEASTEAE